MPQVTPNNTNHLRQNATFRGTRANPYATPALEKENRTKKRRLINRARTALRDPDLQAAAEALVSVKRRWAKVGNAGAEHDKKLQRELEDIYETFRGRYEGVRARAVARRAQIAPSGAASGVTSNKHIDQPYAELGTVLSGGRQNAEMGETAPTLADLSAGPKQEIGTAKRFSHSARTGVATEPSQPAGTLPSHVVNTVGGGAAGKPTAPAPLARPATQRMKGSNE